MASPGWQSDFTFAEIIRTFDYLEIANSRPFLNPRQGSGSLETPAGNLALLSLASEN